jgi:uncharacterized phage protein (TIGR01671 family)
MSDIKFRVWDKHTKEMYDLVSIEFRNRTVQIGFLNNPAWGSRIRRFDHVVIEQFTGLLDRNGKEIYEGDRINVFNWGVTDELIGMAVVVFDPDAKGWRYDSDDPNIHDIDAYDQFRVVEVIGNIHEGINKDA